MKHQIRKSDSGDYFYLLEIDDDNNETFVADNKSLSELKKHDSITGKQVEVIDEAKTRGTVEPPKED